MVKVGQKFRLYYGGHNPACNVRSVRKVYKNGNFKLTSGKEIWYIEDANIARIFTTAKIFRTTVAVMEE